MGMEADYNWDQRQNSWKCHNCKKDVKDEVYLIYCDECAHGFCDECVTFVEHQGFDEAFCGKCIVKPGVKENLIGKLMGA